MIVQTEYQWDIVEDGEAYTATLITGLRFVFRFTRGESTPEIGCRVNLHGETWTGECTEHPDTMSDGMSADYVAKLYARVARDAGDAFFETFKQLGE